MINRLIDAIRVRFDRAATGTEVARTVQPQTGLFRRQNDAQLRYLSHATFLEEAGTPHFLNGAALAACLCVVSFLTWAAMTHITEVSHAPGEIVPAGFEQVVQHLDGGIVKKIEVKAGDKVEKGQVLLTVDDGATFENLQRARSKFVSLELTNARLRAIYDTSVPDWRTVPAAKPEDIDTQTNLFHSALEEQLGRERIVLEQIEQKKTATTILNGQLATAQRNQQINQNILEARRSLFAKQLVAYPVLARAEQDSNQMNGEVVKLNDQIKQNSEALTELTHRLDAIRRTTRLETAARLNETNSELNQLKSSIEALEKRYDRLELRAPVRGLVKAMQVNSLGSVLAAGQTVLTIVPIDEELVVEVQISPRDIGHVRPGQDVHVKFSAYDFSRYGVVKGKLERISAGAFTGRAGEQHYRARVSLAATHVGSNQAQNRIIPGMMVMADIQTGNKSVLDYLLKPVKATAATAFTER